MVCHGGRCIAASCASKEHEPASTQHRLVSLLRATTGRVIFSNNSKRLELQDQRGKMIQMATMPACSALLLLPLHLLQSLHIIIPHRARIPSHRATARSRTTQVASLPNNQKTMRCKMSCTSSRCCCLCPWHCCF